MATLNDLVAAEADNKRLREVLQPLASIALWSDAYPDCKIDHICDYNLSRYFTVDEVKAARALASS